MNLGGRNTGEPSASDRKRIIQFVSQLSTEQRAVLSRSLRRGWTTGETAADLGLADYAVKSILHQALWILLARSTNTGGS